MKSSRNIRLVPAWDHGYNWLHYNPNWRICKPNFLSTSIPFGLIRKANVTFGAFIQNLVMQHMRQFSSGTGGSTRPLYVLSVPLAQCVLVLPRRTFLKRIDTLQHRGHGIKSFADAQFAGMATIGFRTAQSECSSGYDSGTSCKLCNLHGPYFLSWDPDGQRSLEWHLNDCNVHPELGGGPGSYNVSQ